jgi:hypothetical protein
MSSDTPKKPRTVRTNITLLDTSVAVYAGTKVSEALKEVTFDMDIYKGVRLSQVMDALYQQGKKDGARDVFDRVDAVKKEVKHRNPGQPKKPKK